MTRRGWLTDRSYVDLIALCQLLPGATSSQVGIALGLCRAGYGGALGAWVGFTLPSAVGLILFAQAISTYKEVFSAGALHGLKVVAVAVIAQAVWGMARKLCTTKLHLAILLIATSIALLIPTVSGQWSILIIAAIAGLLLFKPNQLAPPDALPRMLSRRAGGVCLSLFFALLIGLPLLTQLAPAQAMSLLDAFYRTGALVFGGGHVVLPMLHAQVVTPGWISNETFLVGYAAAQAVPGPLFTFAAFLGASMNQAPTGWLGGMICLIAIFLPCFLLVAGTLPFLETLRQNLRAQAALIGINVAVIGLLIATLYAPVWTSTIHQPQDVGLALLCLIALMFWKMPPWLVVGGSGIVGWILSTAF